MSTPNDPKWWQSGVIYQIYPRSWADGDGDGVGDFDGMIPRLDYLVDTLGVDAVWVSPFYPSPLADFGYDVADYCDVDPQYGGLAAFDRFLEAAHARGLKVIIDWVPNHSSSEHPWFRESRSSRDNPKRDWYIWRDGREDGSPPNNWVSVFGGPSWTFDQVTGQWYLHSFFPGQPDLNWRDPGLEAAMLDTLRFWLDREVDGFRIDVAHRCMKDPWLRDNPPAENPPEDGYKIDREYVAFDHLYDQAHPDIHLLFRKMRAVADEYEATAPRVLIGEIHEYDWRVWGSYYGWDLSEMHMPYNFILLPTGLDPEGVRRAVEGMEASLPTGAWPNWVIGNHDEPRAATRVGFDESKAAAVLLLTLRGTPTIYYGDEIGMEDVDVPADRRQDPVTHIKPDFGRDGCRTPMRWDGTATSGFSPPGSAEPWLPLGTQENADVARQLGDPGSHLELYRRLLEVRRSSPALQLGTISFLSSWEQPNPLVYRRSNGSDEVVVALNLEPTPCSVTLPAPGTVIAGTHADVWDTQVGPVATLRPFEALVVR